MKFLYGFLIGVAITIGAAYFHDRSTTRALWGPRGSEVRFVNWDVLARTLNELGRKASEDLDRLARFR